MWRKVEEKKRRLISIHAPVKGATPADEDRSSLDTYFNPRSREGSDILVSAWTEVFPISIHAPVKGATQAK